jgi:hypothetical protein
MPFFSQRQGYVRPRRIEFRDTLPAHLRVPLFNILKDSLNPRFLMERISAILDPYGITPLPRSKEPLRISKDEDTPDQVALKRVLLGCEWFHVYDILEDVFRQLKFYEDEVMDASEETRSYPLQKRINEYFSYAGIGWQMVEGQIIARQDEADEIAIQAAESELKEGGRPTAAQRLHSAVRALSERPKPDTAGAVSHATSAVECVLGDITGNSSLTLGKQLGAKQTVQYPFPLHSALRKALDGIYGFASDAGARHGKEGVEPDIEEARFILTSCAAACSLLNAMSPKAKSS